VIYIRTICRIRASRRGITPAPRSITVAIVHATEAELETYSIRTIPDVRRTAKYQIIISAVPILQSLTNREDQ
jgi:hypothetical protein